MVKAYTELFRLKPIGLILSMVLFAHLFALSETGLGFRWLPLLILLGTTAIANAGSFGLNQYYERDADAKMERTKNRPIPSGKISPTIAFVSGFSLFIFSLISQYVFINSSTALATFLCGGIYVWTYTPLKSRSSLSTLIGSIPGALLPFIGWFSVTQGFNLVIVWMSLMIFLWQIPHTFVIVFRYRDEFAAAGGKQLPFVIGEKAALRQSLWYTLYNIPLIFIPVLFGVSGELYLLTALLITSIAVFFVIQLYRLHDAKSSRNFFFYMLIYLPVLFIAMAMNRVS